MKTLFAALLLVTTNAMASNLDCKELASRATTSIGKLNSGQVMKLDSVKFLNTKAGEGGSKIHTFEIYMKDDRTDSYDGYRVTTQEFSGGGCLVSNIKMFQYD